MSLSLARILTFFGAGLAIVHSILVPVSAANEIEYFEFTSEAGRVVTVAREDEEIVGENRIVGLQAWMDVSGSANIDPEDVEFELTNTCRSQGRIYTVRYSCRAFGGSAPGASKAAYFDLPGDCNTAGARESLSFFRRSGGMTYATYGSTECKQSLKVSISGEPIKNQDGSLEFALEL